MPDQNAALAQRRGEIGSAPAPMAREDEVRERRQHLEAELFEIASQDFAARDDAGAGLLKPRVVLDGSDGAGDGEAIDGIGVKLSFNPAPAPRSVAAGRSQSQPQAGERARLREGLDDEQIVVVRDERHGALGAEIDIGFVHHHQPIRVFGRAGMRSPRAEGRPRWARSDCREGWRSRDAGVVAERDPHRGIERHFLMNDAIEPAIDG